MRVRFTGEDGSMGYRRGVIYDLTIQVDRRGAWAGVRDAVHIRNPRPVPYESWDAFWANWEAVDPLDSLHAPPHLDEAAITRYLEAEADAHGGASVHVVLEPLQAAWRNDGGQYVGPGVVHYWRLRDDGTVLSRWVDARTVGEILVGVHG